MSSSNSLMLLAFVVSCAVGFAVSSSQAGPSGGSEQAGVFTAEQADRGRTAYSERCASCHTPDLGGRDENPALAGDSFMSAWKSKTTKELFEFVRDTMPPEGPALKPDEALAIVAHILRVNGAASGEKPLTDSTAVAIGSIATGKRSGGRVRSHAPAATWTLHVKNPCSPTGDLAC